MRENNPPPRKIRKLIIFVCFVCGSGFFAQAVAGQNIPSPAQNGVDARWESAGKQAIGTALSLQSKVWFTLQGGSLTEVFYPTVDNANVQSLQFAVVDPRKKRVETEREDATHAVRTLDTGSLSFTQENSAKSGGWRIRKTYATDPERNSLLIEVEFLPKSKGLTLYVVYDPSIKNSGMKDSAWQNDGTLVAGESEIFSAMKVSGGFSEATSTFSGVNDGLEQLRRSGKLETTNPRSDNGNVIQVARVSGPRKFTLVLSFGSSEKEAIIAADLSLRKGFAASQVEYQRAWREYCAKLPKVEPKYQTQFNFAAMVLRTGEDKTHRGGNVASLSKPWIPKGDANTPHVGGYHLVWPRDSYQIVTAYMSMGETDAPNRALSFIFEHLQKEDGSYPQISWLDGRRLGEGLQMDQVSYPLILAYQLKRTDRETYLKHVKPSADFIVKNGPRTGQERWEEKGGYSPATIAAEIAALVCSAEIARINGDDASAANWLATADEWKKNIEKWTVTTTGPYGGRNYYLRLTQNGKPDAGERMELNNNAGWADEREIVDPSFLELVRLGIKSPDDPLIVKSLKVVDEKLKVNTPNGEAWYRYNRDGYGEMDDGRPWNWDGKWTGGGRLWVLLTGERGEYEIAKCASLPRIIKNGCLNKVKSRLDAMMKFANDGMMIPEQVWDKPNSIFPFGEGAGSGTPLAWSMAQFIRLAMNIKAGRNLETPDVVVRRYDNLK